VNIKLCNNYRTNAHFTIYTVNPLNTGHSKLPKFCSPFVGVRCSESLVFRYFVVCPPSKKKVNYLEVYVKGGFIVLRLMQ